MIEPRLQLIANGTFYKCFWLVPKSMTLDDLELDICTMCQNMCILRSWPWKHELLQHCLVFLRQHSFLVLYCVFIVITVTVILWRCCMPVDINLLLGHEWIANAGIVMAVNCFVIMLINSIVSNDSITVQQGVEDSAVEWQQDQGDTSGLHRTESQVYWLIVVVSVWIHDITVC